MSCENVRGIEKLPLLVLGKVQSTLALASVKKLTVNCTGQKSARVAKGAFHSISKKISINKELTAKSTISS